MGHASMRIRYGACDWSDCGVLLDDDLVMPSGLPDISQPTSRGMRGHECDISWLMLQT
jgi:hypothetical protein